MDVDVGEELLKTLLSQIEPEEDIRSIDILLELGEFHLVLEI